MKRFEFKLESLSRYWQWQKQQLENKFAQVGRELNRQQELLQSHTNQLRKLADETNSPDDSASIDRRVAESDYGQRIRELIARQDSVVEQLQNEHQQLLDQYRRISTEVERLETLRSQMHAEHQSLASKQRQQELNDHLTHAWFNATGEDLK